MADNDQSLYNLRYNQVAQGLEGFGGGTPQWTPLILVADGGINQLTGDVTAGPGAGSQVASISAATVTGKLLTGYVSGTGTVAATDTILQAINKLNGNSVLKANAAVTLTASTGLTGGGDLSANRTFAISATTLAELFTKVAADPVAPAEGDVWYNTTSHAWRGYDGTANGTFTFVED